MDWKKASKARLMASLAEYEARLAAETAPEGWSWNEYQAFLNERIESIHKLLRDLDQAIAEEENAARIAAAEAQTEVISGGFSN
jgi:hypothetical protein